MISELMMKMTKKAMTKAPAPCIAVDEREHSICTILVGPSVARQGGPFYSLNKLGHIFWLRLGYLSQVMLETLVKHSSSETLTLTTQCGLISPFYSSDHFR